MKNVEWGLKRSLIPIGLLVLLLGMVLPRLGEAAPLGRRVEMENELILLVAERPILPMVTVEILVKAGSYRESNHQAGLANLTATLLPLGTVNRTALEISEAIEFVGGILRVDASRNRTSLYLTVLKKDLDATNQKYGNILCVNLSEIKIMEEE